MFAQSWWGLPGAVALITSLASVGAVGLGWGLTQWSERRRRDDARADLQRRDRTSAAQRNRPQRPP